MHTIWKYSAGAAFFALLLPLFGIFDGLLESFPSEAQGALLVIYVSTIMMLIPLDPNRWLGLAFAVICFFFSLYPLLEGTATTDPFQGTDGHVYPIGITGLYAVGFYLILLRSLLVFRKSADGDSHPVPVGTDRN